jgi:hypothetical protein
MQRFFSMIIIFAILVVGGGYLYTQKSGEEAKQEIMDKRAEARRTFADKARAAAREEDNGTYARAMQAAIKSYDEELKKRVYAKRDEMRDPSAYEKEVDKQFKEGLIKEVQHKSMLEGYKMVREYYDVVMAANWTPVLTAKGMGETRIDIFDMHRTRDDEGNPILEGKFFFWGIEDTTHMTWGQLSLRYWGKVVEPVKEGRKTVEKEVEKVLGKAEGDAQPTIFVQNPGKYIPDFPSYVAIGTIWFPVMPREAFAVDIEYSYTAKIGGANVDSALKWEKFAIPASWQLKEGEVWDADTIEATEDEIAGRNPDDPEAGTDAKKDEEKEEEN